jgi:hypothetical protein
MNDLSETFTSSAFEPSDEELTKAAKAGRQRRSRVDRDESATANDDMDMATPPPKKFTGNQIDLDDSSDEEMPDVADLFAGRPGKKKIKKAARKGSLERASASIEDVSLYFSCAEFGNAFVSV